MKQLLMAMVAFLMMTGATAQNKKTVNTGKKLVAYFSCTGTTKSAAEKLAKIVGADLYEIKPAKAYTSADLDWTNKQSRSSVEMANKSSRPAIGNKVTNMAQYQTVFVGFPVWWYVAPTIVNTFLESYNFSGKTIITFATSGGSGIENCDKNLIKTYPKLKFGKGKLLNGTVSSESVAPWLKSNNL